MPDDPRPVCGPLPVARTRATTYASCEQRSDSHPSRRVPTDMESLLSTGAAGFGASALGAVCVVGWVGGGPAVLCATRGQTDMRGLDRRTMDSSWGAAV